MSARKVTVEAVVEIADDEGTTAEQTAEAFALTASVLLDAAAKRRTGGLLIGIEWPVKSFTASCETP